MKCCSRVVGLFDLTLPPTHSFLSQFWSHLFPMTTIFPCCASTYYTVYFGVKFRDKDTVVVSILQRAARQALQAVSEFPAEIGMLADEQDFVCVCR